MRELLLRKSKIVGILALAFILSNFLITYVFPTKSAQINRYFMQSLIADSKHFIDSIFDENIRKVEKQKDDLMQLAKTGTFKSLDKGVQVAENASGAVFKVSVQAMDWEEYKTYTINGKAIKVRVEKGAPSPSQELLEKLAKYYQ